MNEVEAELSTLDQERIQAHGLTLDEVARQLERLRTPPSPAALVRACTPGDGVRQLDEAEQDACIARHEEAAGQGRFSCFVPASGAASRMFKSLLSARGDGQTRREDVPADVRAVLDEATDLAIAGALDDTLRGRGHDLRALVDAGNFGPILDALLGSDGLDAANLPKGLLPFHGYTDGPRTPFEEHLVDASRYARARDGRCRLHFTVSQEHQARFEELLASARSRYESGTDSRFEVGFSTQKSSTDTVAIDDHGAIFRDDDGQILFRPGGHGALISNLDDLPGDIVYIKNIDNVVPDDRKDVVVRWKKVLGGLLVDVESRIHDALDRLDGGDADSVAAARRLFTRELGLTLPDGNGDMSLEQQREYLQQALDRPLRVCGVVRCDGDPGGAPFWVADPDGTARPQLVETAQVDPDSAEQQAIHQSASHFNPVDLVCALRAADGSPRTLETFVDRDQVFLAHKSSGGRELVALEHPGLWNGAMADWLTLFVEVPAETFNPVKTIGDLLSPAHRTLGRAG